MIEEQRISFEGKEYVWYYDNSIDSPLKCWSWIDEDSYMVPPEGLVSHLNRKFIDECAADAAATLDNVYRTKFCKILKHMGATDEDIDAVGLGEILVSLYPEKAQSRFAKNLPSAAHGPLNCVEIRDWFFGDRYGHSDPPNMVSCLGQGPFEFNDFVCFLAEKDVGCREIDEDSSVVVLGRDDWVEERVDELIDLRVGSCLRIYSQEMFLAFLSCGSDPFYAQTSVLEAFKAGHKGLEFVAEGWRGWVTTYVPESRRTAFLQRLDSSEWLTESPLHVLGYRVGKTGETEQVRHRILRQAFTEDLPIIGPSDYMGQWGLPQSPQRLKKMAYCISSFCRIQKSRQHPSIEAISAWEADLQWLRDKYYHGRFQFHWPDTYV